MEKNWTTDLIYPLFGLKHSPDKGLSWDNYRKYFGPGPFPADLYKKL